MRALIRLLTVSGGIALLCGIAVPVSAQITTASVSGVIKDAQGGVVPGAAVTLISEAHSTRLSDVFTDVDGSFTFINVPADRYTIQVSMEGFKTLKQAGVVVSAGDRLGVGALTLDVGTLS